MKATQLKEFIKLRHKHRDTKPLLILGPPGIGKTELVEQAAKEMGVGCRVIHAPLLQPEHYAQPVPGPDGYTFKASKELFPLKGKDNVTGEGILLLDELPQCDAVQQKVLGNLLHTGKIHGDSLAPGWTIVCTGNRPEDGAGANRLLEHVKDRLLPVTLECDPKTWLEWARANGVHSRVLEYITDCPQELTNKCTPRGWTHGVSRMLGYIKNPTTEMLGGAIGVGAAALFLAWLETRAKIPTPEEVWANPKGALVPESPQEQNLIGVLLREHTKDAAHVPAALEYLLRLQPHIGVAAMREWYEADKDLAKHPSMIKIVNSGVLHGYLIR